MLHVDDWLDTPSYSSDELECYAKFVLEYKRMPAFKQSMYAKIMKNFKLFCIHEGIKYRVTGASRIGDIWLNLNFDEDFGYSLRVNVDDCSNWSKE
jgi:hypothetical protein